MRVYRLIKLMILKVFAGLEDGKILHRTSARSPGASPRATIAVLRRKNPNQLRTSFAREREEDALGKRDAPRPLPINRDLLLPHSTPGLAEVVLR